MTKILLILLDCHIDSFNLLKYYISTLSNSTQIECAIPIPLFDEIEGAFSSRFFHDVQLREIASVDNGIQLAEKLASKVPTVIIYKDEVESHIVNWIGICVDSVAKETEEVNTNFVKSISHIEPLLADKAIDHIMGLGIKRPQLPEVNIPIMAKTSGRLVLIFATEIAQSGHGSGMGNQRVSTIETMKVVCAARGYEMIILHEDDIVKTKFRPSDIIHGISVGGLYAGGYTSGGFGFRIRNLMKLADLTKDFKNFPVVACSLHASEAGLIGKPSKNGILKLSGLKYSSYTNNGLEYLRKLKLPTTNEIFPIIATFPLYPRKRQVNVSTKQILLQIDTQMRKNGELSLFAIIDAFAMAKRKRPSLSINVICKSSAAYNYSNESLLRTLIVNAGLTYPNPIKDMALVFQPPTPKHEWEATMSNTDIAVFMSVEEGIHLIVGEVWSRGAFCVFADTPSYSGHKRLDKGISFIPCHKVPYAGAGKHNDMFDTDMWLFDYNKAVKILSNAIISEANIGGRDISNSKVFDHDGSLTAEFLEMENGFPKENISVNFSRRILCEGTIT